MITIEEGIYYRLTNFAGLTALISTRVYPFRLPVDVTLPAVTYQRISTPRENTHDQENNGSDGCDLAMPRFQFTVWDDGFSGAKAVVKQLRKCLHGYTGTFGTGANTVSVYGVLSDNEVDNYDPDSNLYWTTVDYFIHHEE
jgi:hypothetical protein